MDINEFYKECKDRGVVQNISIYAITSWIVIQVAATTSPYLGIPQLFVTILILLIIILLPVVILLSWHYNIVPEEESGEVKISKHEKDRRSRIFKLIFLGLIVFILGLGVWIFNARESEKFAAHDFKTILSDEKNKIAVFDFINNTGIDSLDIVGKMAADFISYRIVENNLATTITLQDIKNLQKSYNQETDNNFDQIANFKGVVNSLKGVYYLEGKRLMFTSSISMINSNQSYAFPSVRCDIYSPLTGIQEISEKVLSFLAMNDSNISQENPPDFKAYKEYLKAREFWLNHDEAIDHLNKAIEIDSNYVAAKILLANKLYNRNKFDALDELLIDLESNIQDYTKRQRNLVKHYKACREGKNKAAYMYLKEEYRGNAQDIFNHIGMMVIAMEFVNKPEEVEEVFEKFNDEDLDYKNNEYLISRLEIKAIADIEIQQVDRAIEDLEKLSKTTYSRRTREILIRAYAEKRKDAKIISLLNNARKNPLDKDWRYLYYIALREGTLHNRKALVQKISPLAIEYYSQKPIRQKMLSRCYLLIGNLTDAEAGFLKFLKTRPDDYFSMAKLIIIYERKGETEKAKIYRQKIIVYSSANVKSYNYLMAQVEAENNPTSALDYLEKALENGQRYDFYAFDHDPYLIPLFELPRFRDLLKYWH